MYTFASFIMRGRLTAIMVIVLASILSMKIPPLSYVSGAAFCLVILRNGYMEGVVVLGGAALAISALSFLLTGSMFITLALLVAVWIPSLILSHVLQRTVSLQKTLFSAALMGCCVVLGIYAVLDQPVLWWKETVLTPFFTPLLVQMELNPEQQIMTLNRTAGLMSGIVASALVLSNTLSLLLARWWQAILYNPGGFKKEFLTLQLGRGFGLLVSGLVLLSLLLANETPGILTQFVIVLLTILFFQGLAIAHDVIEKRLKNKNWLILLYVMIVFIPYVVLMLILLALTDTWVDIRTYIKNK